MKLRIAPIEDWNDAPLAITMQVSSAWISVVIKELLWLTNPSVWDGDSAERDRASQAIEEIIVALSGEGISMTPIGTIIQSALDAPPSGYLDCDGSAVSRTTYAALFAAIGTRFGAGDGTTTFNLPDLRETFIKGANTDTEIGDTGGLSEVTLDISQMPSHYHDFPISHTTTGAYLIPLAFFNRASDGTYPTSYVGGDQPHENEPPWLKLNHFIKF